jgi:hypothetical protein
MERWFSSLEDLGSKLAIAGLLLFGVASYFNFTLLSNFAIVLFGAGVVAWGVNAIQQRELGIFQRDISISERLNEMVARLGGALMVIGGMLALGYGVLALMNPRAPLPPTVRAFFDSTTGQGVLWLTGSVVGMAFGLNALASNARADNAFMRFVLSLPIRLFGLLILSVSCAVAAAGLVQIFAPEVWASWMQSLLEAIGLR